MNQPHSPPSTALTPEDFRAGVEAALRRSAAAALALARATGTPCYVWQDGKIIDIAPADKAAAICATVPRWD